jgi:hypothetical protein
MPGGGGRVKSEAALERYLKRECEQVGVFVRKVQAIGYPGFPDRMLGYAGRVVFIELKSPTGKGILSKKQMHTIETMTQHGLDVRVISSKEGVDDVIRELLKTP